jgi:signal transduction histidine kinase/DNA-binding response OmpR family regulator
MTKEETPSQPSETRELAARVAQLEQEVARLRDEAKAKAAVAARALASYQQRALQMEIIRQQNEDLDRLTAELTHAKAIEEEHARQIETAYRLKSEFLANFSHEIRTPLNAIIGYADLLSREEGSRLTPHGRRDLSTIKNNARTLLALINDILDLSKIEAGHMEVIREPVDLRDLMEECMSTVRELLKGKDVELRSNLDELTSTVFTDPLKLRQILLNLLSNAAKFTEMGEIVATVQVSGTALQLVVEDTGIGIPADQLPHVFEKFRQVDGTHRRKVGGTGLGLAIVRELARLLGGRVEVRSTVGRGTAFTVELPDAVTAAAPVQSESSQPDESGSDSHPRILVIDDDPMVQQLLLRELQSEGFEVFTAGDGVKGLELARASRPSAIVLDLLLPRIDGWSVLSTLKSDPLVAAIPVILLSVEEQRARGLSLGAFEYLVKPVEPERLVEVVRKAVAPGSGDILIVDDDADVRSTVSRRLREEGFGTTEVGSGEAALLAMRSAVPSLIILDLVMPGLDGFAVLQRVRERGLTVPVLIVTGKDLSASERATLQQGLVHVIHKSGVSIDLVVKEARRSVQRRRTIEAQRLPRVLYVEDIAQNRELVRRFLDGSFTVLDAEDGEIGLREIDRVRPDLILMDLSLPRIDGWEVTRRLKQNPQLAHIPVIALSAHAAREDVVRAKAVGCVDYLTKPVDRATLIKTLRRYLTTPGSG